MSNYDMSIHTNPDAVAWARFYTETKERVMRENPNGGPFDTEENMHGWFANAMMAMHDHIKGTAPVVLPDGSAVFVADVSPPHAA